MEHPTPQTAGRPASADAGVWGPGAPRHPSSDGLLVAPPHPWHRRSGTPVFEPAACSTSDHYGPLAGVDAVDEAVPPQLVDDGAVDHGRHADRRGDGPRRLVLVLDLLEPGGVGQRHTGEDLGEAVVGGL